MIVFVYLVSMGVSALGAWIVARFGGEMGLLDRPNARSSHVHPTPKGGGAGIVAAFLLVSLFVGVEWFFWLPAVAVSLSGLAADRWDLSPRIRLLLQVVCAIVFLWGFPETGREGTRLITGVLWVLFLVGTANTYNFMDGINGMAGITGTIAFAWLSLWGIRWGGDPVLARVSLGIALGCLAFLPFNVPSARVFMGDVASTFLGFAFAVFVTAYSRSFLDFLCLCVLLWTFFADEGVTAVVRLKDGENLLRPHRRHLYQLLANEGGRGHLEVSLGYGAVQLLVAGGVMVLRPLGYGGILPFLLGAFLVTVGVHLRIRRRLES